jgi:hypothetical protein
MARIITFDTAALTPEQISFAARPEQDFAQFRHFVRPENDEVLGTLNDFSLNTEGVYASRVLVGDAVGFVALRTVIPESVKPHVGQPVIVSDFRRFVRVQMWLPEEHRRKRIASATRDDITMRLLGEAAKSAENTKFGALDVAAQTYIIFPGAVDRSSSAGHLNLIQNYGMQEIVTAHGLPAHRTSLTFLSAALGVRQALESNDLRHNPTIVYPVLKTLKEGIRVRDTNMTN